MPLWPVDFIKQLEKRVSEKKKPKHMKRSRKATDRYIDSQARERKHDEEKAAQKRKEKKKSKNASKKGKRKRDDLHEESDDEPVGQLVRKHCEGPKRIGVMKSYEQAEEREAKKPRYFIESDDDESVNEEESMIKRVEEKVTDPSLLGGDEISSKIESDRAKHRDENRLTKRNKTKRALTKMRNERNVRNSMKNSNNTNCNNVINNNFNYNFSVGNGSGLGSAQYYPPHPANVQPFPSIQNHQYPYMIGQYQQYQAPVHHPLIMLQPPYHQYHPASGNGGYSGASSSMRELDHLVLEFKNTHKDEQGKKWLKRFMRALTIHQNHPGSLRGGYNSADIRMSDWYLTQRSELQSLSKAKRDLLRIIGLE